jgi:hypothetical protein
MRPAISAKKEEIELPCEVLKAYGPLTVSRQLQITGYYQNAAAEAQHGSSEQTFYAKMKRGNARRDSNGLLEMV